MAPKKSSDVTRSEGYCIKVYSQNCRGLRETNLEEVLSNMKAQSVFAWCLQETWRLGDYTEQHEGGYVCMHHGLKEKINRRGSLGVAIMLSPEAWKGVKAAGNQVPDYYGKRIMAVTMKLKDCKGKEVMVRLVSAYAPHSGCTDGEKDQYEVELDLAIRSCGEDEILIIGSDTNASLSKLIDDDTQEQGATPSAVGKFGCDWTNKAGERMESFLGTHELCLPTTFFQKKESKFPTWYNMMNKRGYQIDHFITRRADLKRIVDAGTNIRNSIYSDHRAIFMKIRIARNLPKISKPSTGRILRCLLFEEESRAQFVKDAEEQLLLIDSIIGSTDELTAREIRLMKRSLKADGKSIQETLNDVLTSAAKKHLTQVTRMNPGWFTDACLKSCHKRNHLQKLFNQNPDISTKKALRNFQTIHKHTVFKAKQDWTMLRVSKINASGSAFVGHYWEAVRDLVRGGPKTSKITPLCFRDPGTLEKCKTEKESGIVLVAHLKNLLNAVPAVAPDAIDMVKQRAMFADLDATPQKAEILIAIRRQNNSKACGDSKIPAEFYKACIDSAPLYKIVELILVQAWEGKETPKEWIEGRIKMLPKDGDLLDPGRWRSITLLDAMAKIMSTILTYRLNKILKLLGIEMQNGFTPGRGTVDGSFCVRTLLKKRKEHGLETYGYFLDLVKAFDTVPRESLLRVLAKFGVPPKMVKVIKSMYSECTVKMKVGDEDNVIPATAGVKQGDNLAPVLFLIYIQAVIETLDEKFPDRKKLPFATKFDHIIHGRRQAKKNLTLFEIGESLYADDAFFGFATRLELEEGAVIIDRHFTSFGLQVHRGKYLPDGKRKKSKTECMYYPAQGTYEDGNTSDIIVDNGFYAFTKTFKYLGSIITYDLSADADVKNRIRCATAAFGRLRSTLTSKKTKIKQRSAIYVTIVISILLFGSETWGCREDLLSKLEVFHNQCVRQICHVTRMMQWKKRVKTITLNNRVGLPTITDMIASRQLRWAGHVARMDKTRGPRMLMTSFVQNNRPLGRPVQSFGHSLRKFLILRADSMNEHQLKQSIDIQLDPNSDVLTRITGYELQAALRRTTHLLKNQKGELTWIDITPDRDIWRMLVLNNFNVMSVMHVEAFMDTKVHQGQDVYDAIHDAIPKRPKLTKKSKRNKLPKLYAIWSGARTPEGRLVKINEIFDSWLVVKPIVFKVSGAQYISATNNAAGRKHLKYWLDNHTQHSGGLRVLMRKDGKRFYFNRNGAAD